MTEKIINEKMFKEEMELLGNYLDKRGLSMNDVLLLLDRTKDMTVTILAKKRVEKGE